MIYLVFLLAIINFFLVNRWNKTLDAYYELQDDYGWLNELSIKNYKKLEKEYTILTVTSLHTIHYLLLLLEQSNIGKKDEEIKNYFEIYSKFFDDIIEKETKKYDKNEGQR